jgi:hypothetical protein
VDKSVVPLILLPMNTTKVDVFHFVNEEVKTLVGVGAWIWIFFGFNPKPIPELVI